MPLMEFQPDVLAEITRVCDRACEGCYAINIVLSRHRAPGQLTKHGVHIDVDELDRALRGAISLQGGRLGVLGLRGGEPSLHPRLSDVLECSGRAARTVYMETHGRWALHGDGPVMDACARYGTRVKVSFDSMHGLDPTDLRTICCELDVNGIDWIVAITETDQRGFQERRAECDWVPDERLVYQNKATRAEDLVVPRLGVIRANGSWARTLTSRRHFVVSSPLVQAVTPMLRGPGHLVRAGECDGRHAEPCLTRS